jgi:hypothetical protein
VVSFPHSLLLNLIFQLNSKSHSFLHTFIWIFCFVVMWRTSWNLSKHFRYTLSCLLLLALQPTVGFSLLSNFLPFRPFLTQFSPPSYSHYLYIFSVLIHILVSYSKLLSWGRSGFHHWILRQHFSLLGQRCQPCAQPPTWKTRVSLLVWSLY